MDRTSTDMTVADYAGAFERGDIEINKNYQRSDKVWPDAARSFLIETIVMGFPIPKLSLHQITDVRSRRTKKHVVDGQQRSAAIWSFLNGEFPISANSELTDAAGRTYDDLPDDIKQSILDYSLSFDLFINTSEAEVREVFRRINSFTVPLNAEEHRHAEFQGKFKWFIYHLAREFDVLFIESGMFSSKQLVRMQDTKWLSEVSHATTRGITTTSKTALDALYRTYDKDFPLERELRSRFESAFDVMLGWTDLHRTAMFRPFVAYSFVLAIMHCHGPIEALQAAFPMGQRIAFDEAAASPGLTALADALENAEDQGAYAEFVRASTKGTNVKAAREARFRSICQVLVDSQQL